MTSESTQSTQRILKEHSESNQRDREQSYFVIESEPKMLRLVLKIFYSLLLHDLEVVNTFLHVIVVSRDEQE